MQPAKLDESIYYLRFPGQTSYLVGQVFLQIICRQLHVFSEVHGHNLAIVDRLSGEVFNHLIFIYSDPADAVTNQLIGKFVESKPTLDESLIDQAVSEVACWSRRDYQIIDRPRLIQGLNSLFATNFRPISSLRALSHQPRQLNKNNLANGLAISKYPRKLKTVVVNYIINGCSPGDMVVVANLFPIITNLTVQLMKPLGLSCSCRVIDDENDQTIVIGMDFTAFSGSYCLKAVHEILYDVLDTDITKYPEDLARYCNYDTRPSWLVHNYLTIGLLTSWSMFRQQLTDDRVKQVWQRLKIYWLDEFDDTSQPSRPPLR